MKALSIRQPWASLIAKGIKDIENRTWKTNFRGKIYIHAPAKKLTKSKYVSLIELYMIGLKDERIIEAKNKHFDFNDLNYSVIIGEVEIIDCVKNHNSIWADHQTGLQTKPTYNWILANPIEYIHPYVDIKGKLSFWEFDKHEHLRKKPKK